MKLLWLDIEGEATGLDIALRAKRVGHDVRFYQPPHKGTGKVLPYGEGLLTRVSEWQDSADWAELIVVNGNSGYHTELAEFFGKGYPLLGTNSRAAQLELDRQVGQEVLERYGIETLPYTVVDSVEEAIAHIAAQGKPVVAKPWGGHADKAMTFVANTPEAAIFTLQRWARAGLFKGQLMLQEKADGVEMGISGMFGPHGWCEALEESWEHKKLMPSNYGPNTGEMGTVVRHVTQSKLFDAVLAPITPYLHEINYIGDCSVNCIIDAKGVAWPLEFTMRWGHPDLALRVEALKVDPIEFMAALVHGEDRFVVSPQVVVGVVMAHGDFPRSNDPLGTWADFPITADEAAPQLHWQMVKRGEVPTLRDGAVGAKRGLVTAGNYVCVVTAQGETVSAAARAAYAAVDEVRWPGDVIVRDDIGERLKGELWELQRHGFAEGLDY